MSHVDTETLLGLKELLGDKFAQLIDSYNSDCGARFERMQSAIESGDLNAVRHEAHGIKGSSRNIGANAIADLCGQIETQAHAGDDTGLQQKIADVEQILAAIKSELLALLDA